MKNITKLSTLALLGLTVGLGSHATAVADITPVAPQAAQNQEMMTESELLGQLNDESKKLYQSLSPEGKELARRIASNGCKGMNSCKGQGGCKSAEHGCAGMNGCAGQGAAPIHDPNVAVKMAAKKMAEKRNGKPTGQKGSTSNSQSR